MRGRWIAAFALAVSVVACGEKSTDEATIDPIESGNSVEAPGASGEGTLVVGFDPGQDRSGSAGIVALRL